MIKKRGNVIGWMIKKRGNVIGWVIKKRGNVISWVIKKRGSFPDQLGLAWSHSSRRLAAGTETVLNCQMEPPSSLEDPLAP